MTKFKEKLKKEIREVPIKTWFFLIISLILVGYFIYGDNIKVKLILGVIFFIIHGSSVIKENKFAGFSEIIAGLFGLTVLLLQKQPLWLLDVFYALVLIMLVGFLYFHRKLRKQAMENKIKLLYHFSYILLSLYVSFLAVIMMKSLIGFGFGNVLPVTDYIFIVELCFICIITFFLLADNIIRLIPLELRKNLIGEYSAAHAVFCSLCLTILIGGFFYINAQDNPILQKVLIVLGAAFFTSLVIAESIKGLFK